ncbi:hypothetical protein, partial [Luedemannella flava]|uniref:hypothetical protein n=1 Tax=Luedemannella flava TaxID=349316 RepID=UPI0031D5F4C3
MPRRRDDEPEVGTPPRRSRMADARRYQPRGRTVRDTEPDHRDDARPNLRLVAGGAAHADDDPGRVRGRR